MPAPARVDRGALAIKGSEQKPGYAPAIVEDLMIGARLFRRAFTEGEPISVSREVAVFREGGQEAGAFQISRGFAYRSITFRDGRRAILDVLLPGDVVGLERVVLAGSTHDVFAANSVAGRILSKSRCRELLEDPRTGRWLFALMAEARGRMDRVASMIARCDARERLAGFLLDIYDRLRHRELITGQTFNLPLTQEQIGDHLGLTMVHVNRTLRQLRQDGLVLAGRGVVILLNIEGLRAVINTAAHPTSAPEPVTT